jgi:hypothetical protein
MLVASVTGLGSFSSGYPGLTSGVIVCGAGFRFPVVEILETIWRDDLG